MLGTCRRGSASRPEIARAGPSRRATNTSGGICGNCGGRDHGRANCPDNCNVKGCGKPAHAHVRTCPWHPTNIEQRRQERLAERSAARTDRNAPPPPAFRQNFGGRANRAQQRRDTQANLLSIKESKATLHVLLASASEADRPRLELYLKDTLDSEAQMTAALLELGTDSDGDHQHYGSDEDRVASLLASYTPDSTNDDETPISIDKLCDDDDDTVDPIDPRIVRPTEGLPRAKGYEAPPTSADVTDDNAASTIAATPALATISGNAVESSHNSANTGGNTTASSADTPAEASTTASSGANNYKISGWFVPQVMKRERRGAAFRTLLLASFLGMFTTAASAAMPPVPTNTAMHDSAFNAKSWARCLLYFRFVALVRSWFLVPELRQETNLLGF